MRRDKGTEIKHGTLNAYCYKKCRCEECVLAWREYHNKYRRDTYDPVSRSDRYQRTGY